LITYHFKSRITHVNTHPASASRLNRVRALIRTRWLTIGIGVKRWLLLLLLGITFLGLGLAYALIDIYRTQPLPDVFYYLTLQFLPRILRAILVAAVGFGSIGLALIKLSRALLEPFARPGKLPIAEAMYQYRQRGRGPKIVAIGGGTGLSTFLRGIKAYTSNITAIVTVADDGGSSGRLRREYGIPPPGDFRQCIAALADDEALTTHLFQYRFGGSASSDNGAGLGGHAFGNLFIAAMTNVTGSFESGLAESSQVLAVRGRVLPSTVAEVTLVGDVQEDDTSKVRRVKGESVITHAGATITRLSIEPDDAPAYPEAVRAILHADAIVLASGSLYTSLLPNLLVHGIANAIRASQAPCIYVCNVATQKGETINYSVRDHVSAIEQHIGPDLIDAVIANEHSHIEDIPFPSGVGDLIHLEMDDGDPPILAFDVVDESAPWRHDSNKLAAAVMQTIERL
jgi:uncharacterized cofD-like protein